MTANKRPILRSSGCNNNDFFSVIILLIFSGRRERGEERRNSSFYDSLLLAIAPSLPLKVSSLAALTRDVFFFGDQIESNRASEEKSLKTFFFPLVFVPFFGVDPLLSRSVPQILDRQVE